MFKAFNAFITTLFTACNSLAQALNHLAMWSEESAAAFSDEARHNRAAQAIELSKQLAGSKTTK